MNRLALRPQAAAAAAIALVAEYLLFSFLYDAEQLLGHSLRAIGGMMPVFVVGLAALLVPFMSVTERGSNDPGSVQPRSSVSPREHRLRVSGWTIHAAASIGLFMVASAARDAGRGYLVLAALVGLALLAVLALVPVAFRVDGQRFASDAIRRWGVGVGALAVIAYGGGLATAHLWEPLGWLTLSGVKIALMAFSDHGVVFDAPYAIIGTERFHVTVAPVCSGYEGMGLMAAFAGAYILLRRRVLRFPQVLTLVPVAVFAAFVANIVRIAALILIGSSGARELALGSFHSKAGWVAFSALSLGLVFGAERVRWFKSLGDERSAEVGRRETSDELISEKSVAESRGPGVYNPVPPYVAPLVLVLAAGLLSGVFGASPLVSDLTRIGAAALALFLFRSHLASHLRWPTPVGVGLGLVGAVLWLFLSGVSLGDPASSVAHDGLGILVLHALTYVIISPVVEELAFRGYLLRRLVAVRFEEVDLRRVTPLAVVVSSLLFGFLHSAWLAGVACGLVFAFAQSRSGRLADAMAAHAVTNGLLLALRLSGVTGIAG